MNINKRIKQKEINKKGNKQKIIKKLTKFNKKHSKVLGYRTVPFLERQLRKQKECYNKVAKRVRKENGIFTTYDDLSYPSCCYDIYFLSKKHPNLFYNVTILSAYESVFDELVFKMDALNQIWKESLFQSFFDSEENAKKSILATVKNNIKTTVDETIFVLDESYSYGVGLTIFLNNGKNIITEEEINQAIQQFWDNGEVDFTIQTEEKDYLDLALNQLGKSTFFRLLKEELKADNIVEEMHKKGELTEREKSVLLEKEKVIILKMDDLEDNDYYKTRLKAYDKLENNKDYIALQNKRDEINKKYQDFPFSNLVNEALKKSNNTEEILIELTKQVKRKIKLEIQ